MVGAEMNSPETQKFIGYLLGLPHNKKCADCGKNSPTWCAWTYGLFICYECAGQHRKLGPEKSRVKNVTMDAWSQEELRRIYVGGNKLAYKITGDPDISIKYKDCGEFVAELDRRCEASREKEPGDVFMKIGRKPTSVSFGSTVIKKKAVPKFSDNIPKKREPINVESEKVHSSCPVRSPAPKETPTETSKTALSDVALLSRKQGSTVQMPKNIEKSRSPFSFKPESQSDEEDSE
ncbi:hypothetical protein PAEPH01_0180 [Pancytospora epiphaga]|nr:hypothetical protein PAEPH01_0180 [Pancytospora epiphaga]